MRKYLLFMSAAALLFATGCASVLRFELPSELKGKKLKEDPPITLLPSPLHPSHEDCA